MANQKAGWLEVELEVLSKFIDYRGRTPKKTESGIPLITAKNIKDGFISREPREYIAELSYDEWMVRGIPKFGDVLFTTEAPLGNVATIDIVEKFALAQRAICFQFYVSEVGRFIYYALRSSKFQEGLRANSTGTTVKGIKAATLKTLRVALPPQNEQTRIANKLDQLLAQVDTIQSRLDKLPYIIKRFRQSVLSAAVSGRLTEVWREKNECGDSTRVKVEDLCLNSFYGPRFSKDDYSDTGIPTIRTTDMTKSGKIEVTINTPRVVVAEDKIELFRVKKGDLLITRTGSIGTMAIFMDDYLAIPSAYLIRFRFNEKVKVEYLYIFLTSPIGQMHMGLGTTAITQPNINAKTIKAIELPLPPLEEQTEIVRLVDQYFALADTIEKNLANAKARVDNLTQAILAKAFRGELVDQDPNDEPAEKLLERIKAARAEAEKLEKATKKAARAGKKTAAKPKATAAS